MASVLPFLVWVVLNLNADFWYDEVSTLQGYVFVPLLRTVTDYPLPNNHILFSLVNNVFLRVAGVHDLILLLARPWLVRLLPLCFSLVAVWLIYLTARRLLDRQHAFLPVLVLCTSVPFANFATQVRGFSLSIMLLCLLLYCLVRFRQQPGPAPGIGIVLATALALYTIPLNLYFILAIGLIALFALFRRLLRKQSPRLPLLVIALLVLGTALAALAYAPVLANVVSNSYVRSRHAFNFSTISGTLPQVFNHFLSFRYLLLVPFVAGVVLRFRRPLGRTPLSDLAILLSLLLLPFVFSFLRGDEPTQRVFVNLLPVFALAAGVGLALFGASSSNPLHSRPLLYSVLLIVYCQATFGFSVLHMVTRLRRDIGTTRKAHDIFYAYYQAHYHPRRLLAEFDRGQYDHHTPVVTFDVDQAALPVYLAALGIPHENAAAFEPMLATRDRLYVITALPDRFASMMKSGHPEFETKRLNPQPGFHNVFLLTRTGLDNR